MSETTTEAVDRAIDSMMRDDADYDQIIDVIQALAACVTELEGALGSHHAEVGHNIWRFWRDQARDSAKKNTILAARVAELEAENARLNMILTARDAFDRGEPSQPPHTGRTRAALQKDTTEDHADEMMRLDRQTRAQQRKTDHG